MKQFKCTYLKVGGAPDYDTCQEIEASGAEEAAQIYAQRHPSEHPRIDVSWGVLGNQVIVNPTARAQEEEARPQEEASRIAARVESLKELVSKVENTNGNLGDLSYDDLGSLVENMRDFPGIRDELSPEECAVREKLYKMAFFDRNLQVGLLAMTRISPQSGKSPQSSSTRSSEVSIVADHLEGIHFWVKFMGVVLLISIICSVVILLLEGAAD